MSYAKLQAEYITGYSVQITVIARSYVFVSAGLACQSALYCGGIVPQLYQTHTTLSCTRLRAASIIVIRKTTVSYFCLIKKEGQKCFIIDTLNTFYFTVIWRETYGKGPHR